MKSDKRKTMISNERTKLSAALLNIIAGAMIIFGLLGPAIIGDLEVSVLWTMGGVIVHAVGRLLLGALDED